MFLVVNKSTDLGLLFDLDRIVAIGFLPKASCDVKKLVKTTNLCKYGFFNVDASLEPPLRKSC